MTKLQRAERLADLALGNESKRQHLILVYMQHMNEDEGKGDELIEAAQDYLDGLDALGDAIDDGLEPTT